MHDVRPHAPSVLHELASATPDDGRWRDAGASASATSNAAPTALLALVRALARQAAAEAFQAAGAAVTPNPGGSP